MNQSKIDPSMERRIQKSLALGEKLNAQVAANASKRGQRKSAPKAKKGQATKEGRAYASAAVNPTAASAKAQNKAARSVLSQGRSEVKSENVKGFLRSQAFPEESRGSLCPFSHNNEPSVRVTPATTTSVFDVGVASNITAQLSFYPGHALPDSDNAMDPVSFHSRFVTVPGTGVLYIPGPISVVSGSTTYAPSCVNVKNGLVLDTASEDLTGSTFKSWDSPLPYVGVTSVGHSRWQLVSMSVKITNNTVIGNRGGSVTTVQKLNNNVILGAGGSNPLQAQFAIYPSFKVWGNRDIRITKTLRSEDQAMWHVPLGGGSDESLRSAGLKVFLNNPSTFAQSYTVTTFWNWQLAGDLFGTVSTPLFVQPSSIMDSVTSVIQNFFPSAQQTGRVYEFITRYGFDKIPDLLMKFGTDHEYAHLDLAL